MKETPIQDERAALMEQAQKLEATLRDLAHEVRLVSARLIDHADRLLIPAADEQDEQGRPKVSPISLPAALPQLPLPLAAAKLPPGKRGCSLCRKPGHKAPNCPDAHLVRQRDMAEKATGKKKRTRKPMTPEQRAKSAEILKKARAARKGKK